MGKFHPNRPKSAGHRLEMFLTLASAFIDAADTLGRGPAIPRGEEGSQTYREDVWRGLFKVMLLRKFFSDKDEVQIPKVVEALRECNRDPKLESVEQTASYIRPTCSGCDDRSGPANGRGAHLAV